jgi:hypothetical protein
MMHKYTARTIIYLVKPGLLSVGQRPDNRTDADMRGARSGNGFPVIRPAKNSAAQTAQIGGSPDR